MSERRERRLQAILAADVAGYSRLMNRDEEGTLARLQALERDAVDPAITGYGGSVVKRMGDGILAVFPSAVEALRAAQALQSAVDAHAAAGDGGAPIRYRVGLNVGDVIVTDDDIFGDGVNIAARLEGLAEPGGITLSAAVHDNVRAQVDGPYDDLGERTLKNIERPVRVYRLRTGTEVMDAAPAPVPVAAPRRWWLAIATLLLAGLAVAAWQLWPVAEAPAGAGSVAPAAVPPPPTSAPPTVRAAEPTAPVVTNTPQAATPESEPVAAEPSLGERLLDAVGQTVEEELRAALPATSANGADAADKRKPAGKGRGKDKDKRK